MAEQTIFEYNTKNNIMKNHYVDLNGSEYLQAEIYNAITGTSTKLTCSLDPEFKQGNWNSPFSNCWLGVNGNTPYIGLDFSSSFHTYMYRLQSALSRSNLDTYMSVRIVDGNLVPVDNSGNMQKNIRTNGYEWSQEGSGNAIRLRDFGCSVDKLVNEGVVIKYLLSLTPLDYYEGYSGELGFQQVRLLFTRGEFPNGSINTGSWVGTGTLVIQCSGGEVREYVDMQHIRIENWDMNDFGSNNWHLRIDGDGRASSNTHGTVQNIYFEGTVIDTSNCSISISAA